jgi:uncharacterized membrane protein YcjF (UPF0283 family)
MQVDSGWLAITTVCALVTLTALFIVAAGVAYLVLKVRRLARLAKALPERVAERSKAIAEETQGHGRRLTERGRRTGDVLRASLGIVKDAMDDAGKMIARRPVEGPGFLKRLARRRGPREGTTDA